MSTADCFPVTATPGISRLYADFCASAVPQFLTSDENWFAHRPPTPAHWPELVSLLAAQNPWPSAAPSLEALANGAGTVLTGQQVTLFGGPLFTPFKAATALARARTATAAGHPHAAIFWLATEDHDFAEINHATFPARRSIEKLVYSSAPQTPIPVGGVVIDDSITPLIDRAWELIGFSDAMEALAAAYKPGRTFAQAFADFYSKIFAAQGLLIVDAAGREFHRLGAPVLRAGIEMADELHAALVERNKALEAAGYHAQVAVTPQSSLLFLIDGQTGARLALKRTAPTAAEPNGLWQAGRLPFSTDELLGILNAAPESISPSALLRPVFQDYLFGSSTQVGGPAEIAYLAQSAVLFERILGRQTPPIPRFSGTLIEPAVGELLRRHELSIAKLFHEDALSLAQRLATRAMPIETKKKLASAGNALDAELTTLLDWMRAQDEGLGRSAEASASKMRYQMNRLRNLAANFELQREASLTRHAETIIQAIAPGGSMQERVHGAAFYFARYGIELAETLVTHAENPCPGHRAVWL
ncbi:MAG: bacillithiol biosynthesis cysteine-adding enzyme BshC [Terracidiphilus sp.]